MKPNLLPFIYEKWNGVLQPTTDFSGKTIIVTGSNVGLGFEAASKFVALNAETVILAVRNVSKGTTAKHNIEERTNRTGVVQVWELDMNSYASVQRFVDRVNQELVRLDVAVLNAGIATKDYTLGGEGWESILQVNVLGTALLGLVLLPKLKASKTSEDNIPHLVVVTSEAHRWLEDKDFPDASTYEGNLLEAVGAKPAEGKAWDGQLQNARSKLFAQYVSNSLAALAKRSNGEIQVIVTSVCPGACKSDLTRDFMAAGIGWRFALGIFDLLFNKTTEQGARVYIAAASLGAEGHGTWYKTTALTR